MMSTHEEDEYKWVDDLLRKLPAPTPIPEDISKQLDKFLADHIATLEAESKSKSNNVVSLQSRGTNRFTSRYQILVAAAAVLGILTFAGTQTSLFTSQSGSSEVAAEPNQSPSEPTPAPEQSATEEEAPAVEQESEPTTSQAPTQEESSPNQGTGEMVNPEVDPSDIQVLGSEGGTEYLPGNAPNVQITKSGMDYAKNLDAILDEIAPYGEPGKLNKLSNAQLGCVVKFKLVDRVVAVDSGRYNGESIVTFFAIADDGTTKAYVTKPGDSCELVKKFSIN